MQKTASPENNKYSIFKIWHIQIDEDIKDFWQFDIFNPEKYLTIVWQLPNDCKKSLVLSSSIWKCRIQNIEYLFDLILSSAPARRKQQQTFKIRHIQIDELPRALDRLSYGKDSFQLMVIVEIENLPIVVCKKL